MRNFGKQKKVTLINGQGCVNNGFVVLWPNQGRDGGWEIIYSGFMQVLLLVRSNTRDM